MAGENNVVAQQRQRRRAIAGGLLIAGVTTMALLIFFLDDLLDAVKNDYTVHVVMTGASVPTGAPVWVNGRAVGTVEAVGLLPGDHGGAARIVLTLRLPVSARDQVRTDSRVRVRSKNLTNMMGVRVVDVAAGSATAPILDPGDTLVAPAQPTRVDVARRARVTAHALDSAITDARAHMPAIRQRFTEAKMALTALDGVIGDIGLLADEFDTNALTSLLRDSSFVASIHNVRDHVTTFESRLDTLGARMDEGPTPRFMVGRLLERADTLRAQLAFADSLLNDPNTTYARIRGDSALVHAIRDARAELEALVADVRRNPMRYAF